MEFQKDFAVCRIGGLAFRVPKGMLIQLADRGVVEESFKRAVEPNRTFEDIDCVENFARVTRLLRKGLDLDQAARAMKLDPGKVRKFYGHCISAGGKYGVNQVKGEADRQGELEGDYCRCAEGVTSWAEPGKPLERIFINAATVKQAQKAGKCFPEIAALVHADRQSFDEWLDKNAAILGVL